MEKRDERKGESDALSLSLHHIGDLPKEIQEKPAPEHVVMGEGDGVSAWIKTRI